MRWHLIHAAHDMLRTTCCRDMLSTLRPAVPAAHSSAPVSTASNLTWLCLQPACCRQPDEQAHLAVVAGGQQARLQVHQVAAHLFSLGSGLRTVDVERWRVRFVQARLDLFICKLGLGFRMG